MFVVYDRGVYLGRGTWEEMSTLVAARRAQYRPQFRHMVEMFRLWHVVN